jgi:hypothetical protein
MKVSKRDLVLLSVLGVIALFGGFYWFLVKPAKADLGAQRDALAQVQSESGGLRDTLSRLSISTKSVNKLSAERLRLSKALPDGTETPGIVVQLQRLADRSNVQLTSIKTNSFSDYGSIRGTEFEVRVTGRFFDTDDFLYRLHRQVAVDEKDRPIVGGRLFATTSVDLTLDQSEAAASGPLKDGDHVVATIRIVAFSSVPGGAASTAVAAPVTPVSSSAPATAAAQATAAPTTGGTQ